jgi:Na+/H+ antiporter NhaA
VVTSTHGGIHPTIIGTALGLLWGGRGFEVMKKVAYFGALPLFLLASTSMRFDFSVHALTNPLVWQLIASRMIGKPVGILVGAFIGYALLRMRHEHAMRLKVRELVIAGFIATLGLDVAVIFANVALANESQRALAILAIFVTIPVSVAGIIFARYFLTRATAA